MTKNEQILTNLLSEKGYNVKDIWYWPTFGFQDGGWTATIIEKDEFGDEIDQDYHLGRDFIEAKGQIEHDKISPL